MARIRFRLLDLEAEFSPTDQTSFAGWKWLAASFILSVAAGLVVLLVELLV
jgi:hypothetical protein